MSSYNVTSRIHVWLGLTSQSRAEFARYFELSEADRVQGRGASQFDKDLQIKWYDDDLIGVYYNDADDRLAAALDEVPTSPQAIEQMQARCAALGFTRANALFYYEDAGLTVAAPDKHYNGLTYLGSFDNT